MRPKVKVVRLVLYNATNMNSLFKKNLYLTIAIVFLISTLLLLTIEGAWKDWEMIKGFLEEIIIVTSAAIIVGLYFEFKLRREISLEFTRIIEIKEKFGKSGIVKYFSNFNDADIRSYFDKKSNKIDIYVNYANTFFKSIEDKLETICKRDDLELNIFLLSQDNKFISGLGELWGKSNKEYDETGIKSKIESTCNLLKKLFERLKSEELLKARIKVYVLKRHPVFHSLYRFDDEMFYVPLKVIESKSFIPFTFLVHKTINSDGIYYKCMQELENIKQDQNSVDIFFNN